MKRTAVACALVLLLVFGIYFASRDPLAPPTDAAPVEPSILSDGSDVSIQPDSSVSVPPPSASADAPPGFAELILRDPQAAAEYLAGTDDLDTWDAFMPAVMAEWTTRDPLGAAAWLQNLPAGDFRTDASDEFLHAWGEGDPVAAARWLGPQLANRNPASPPDGLGSFVAAWTLQDPASVRDWLDGLGPAAPPAAYGTLAFTWASENPGEARAWASTLADPTLRSRAATNVALAWAESEPAQAAAWLKGFPEIGESTRSRATLGVLMAWTEIDAAGASRWLLAQPKSTLNESARTIFSQTLADTNPTAGLAWARSITDDTERSDTVADIYDSWLGQDTPAAKVHLLETILATDDVDPALQRTLLDLLYHHDPDFKDEALTRVLEP